MPVTRKPSKPTPKPAPVAKPHKRSRGRPAGQGYHPTDEQRSLVVVMAAMGLPEEQQVLAIINPETKKPISPVTLRKHFREELDKGMVQANTKVAAALFKNATTPTDAFPGGIPSAQIFWSKVRMRWQQRPELNLPPPAEPDERVNMEDAMRRAAFVLAAAVSEQPPEPAKPAKKKAPSPA